MVSSWKKNIFIKKESFKTKKTPKKTPKENTPKNHNEIQAFDWMLFLDTNFVRLAQNLVFKIKQVSTRRADYEYIIFIKNGHRKGMFIFNQRFCMKPLIYV